MKKYRTLFTLVLASLTLTAFSPQKEVKDFLSIGDNLEFNNETYHLKWSANPSENYYKQEYLRDEDDLESFNKMITIDAIKGDISVTQAASIKVNELKKLKETNPVVNYEVYANEKAQETMIDFVISDGAHIYEWNIYRYKQQKIKKETYLVLYAYSYRRNINTREELMSFFNQLKETRMDMINELGSVAIPNVNVVE